MTDQTQDVEANVDENEIVSEASMSDNPKDAEAASVTGVKAAANATKQTQPPKTKAGMIQGLMTKLQSMSKHLNCSSVHESYMEDAEVAADVETVVETQEAEYDFSGDLNALVESEATLSDGFKDKAATIFEAAVKSKLSEEIARIEESYVEELAEKLLALNQTLSRKSTATSTMWLKIG